MPTDQSDQFESSHARYMPTPRECALLLLHLIKLKEEASKRAFPRLRISDVSLRRLWGRSRLTPGLIDEVNEWLVHAGRALFFAGSTYAVARTSAVGGWPLMAAKRLYDVIDRVTVGAFDFATLEPLLPSLAAEEADTDEPDD